MTVVRRSSLDRGARGSQCVRRSNGAAGITYRRDRDGRAAQEGEAGGFRSSGRVRHCEDLPVEDARADDLDAIADWFVREIAPAAIRSWAEINSRRHRLRWSVRAETVAGLPSVSTWPMSRYGTRRPPGGWTEIVLRTAGCEDLSWVVFSVSMVAGDSRAWGYDEPPFRGIVEHFRAAGHALRLLPDDSRLFRVWSITRSLLHQVDPARTHWSEGWETEAWLTSERDLAAPLTSLAHGDSWSAAVRAAIA